MGESEMDSNESGWTPENLQRLFSAMKKSISDQDRNKSYNYGLKNVKWTTVAFPPFSASECKRKWMDIFRTLMKMRSLTELIVDAESSLSDRRHKGNFVEKFQCTRKECDRRVVKLRKQCFQVENHMKEQRARRCGKPKFPTRTNQLIFFKEKMNQLRKKIPVWKERFNKVCQMWGDLPKSQRNTYTEICNARQLKYQNELRQWFESQTPKLQAVYLECNPSKRKYLEINKASCQQQQEALFLPSDSEDEDIVCSSDEENDDDVLESEKDEEREEQEESFIFEMY